MNTDITIIGDVHGKIKEYKKIIGSLNCISSIQIGDFGFKPAQEWHKENIDSRKHKIIFGNHDDYDYLLDKHSMGNTGDIINKNGFTIRGAYSIDKNQRILGYNYFANEELNYREMDDAINLYIKRKPKIVLSHDCPQGIRESFFNINDKSNTSIGLQAMWELHQPEIWIFGHHHKSKNEMLNGTKFICLNELETYII